MRIAYQLSALVSTSSDSQGHVVDTIKVGSANIVKQLSYRRTYLARAESEEGRREEKVASPAPFMHNKGSLHLRAADANWQKGGENE